MESKELVADIIAQTDEIQQITKTKENIHSTEQKKIQLLLTLMDKLRSKEFINDKLKNTADLQTILNICNDVLFGLKNPTKIIKDEDEDEAIFQFLKMILEETSNSSKSSQVSKYALGAVSALGFIGAGVLYFRNHK